MENSTVIHAVTGAFGYSGRYIARRLLSTGFQVITLTNSVDRDDEFGAQIKSYPFSFDNPKLLTKALEHVDILYNTYWVRFNHKYFKHADAVSNTKTLFTAAKNAGVRRIVHVSITNPSLDSPLEYFSGKAALEQALIESGISYAILRPTVLFGKEDILINNIAWVLRRLPVFGVFGDGDYKLQPIFVDDLAELAVACGQSNENLLINAIGPETYTYRELVTTISQAIGVTRPIIPVNPEIGFLAAKVLGALLRDVLVTREEIQGLMANLLYVDDPPTGKTVFSSWVIEHAVYLGRNYHNELARRLTRLRNYD